MPSIICGFARPVRSEPNSPLSFSRRAFISSSVSVRNFWILADSVSMSVFSHSRPDRLSAHGAGDVALDAEIEHHDREPVVHAKRQCGRIHHAEPLVESL